MLDDLVRRFNSQAIPMPEWTHEAHLLVGTWHVQRFGPEEALRRLREGIRRLNDAHGTPNSATRGYHETITCAYVILIAEFLAGCPEGLSADERARALAVGPIGARDVLLRFYSKERLMSEAARREWHEPDLAPLSLPGGSAGASC
jgi:hypothetical protein